MTLQATADRARTASVCRSDWFHRMGLGERRQELAEERCKFTIFERDDNRKAVESTLRDRGLLLSAQVSCRYFDSWSRSNTSALSFTRVLVIDGWSNLPLRLWRVALV